MLRGTLVLLFALLFTRNGNTQDFKKIINESNNDSLVIQAYVDLMKAFGPNNVDSVKLYGEQALDYLKKRKYPKGDYSINYSIANTLSFHGKLTEAESYCDKAIKIAERNKWLPELAKSYGLMTMIYGKKGEFIKATSFVFKSLRIHEKLNNQEGMVSAYIKLSAITVQTKDFKSALDYAIKGDSINNITIKDKKLKIDILNNKAIAYAELGKLDEALQMFENIYHITANDPVDITQKAWALMNIGLVYKEKKNYNLALSYYKKSFDESIKQNFPEGILKNIQNISTAYHLLGNYSASNKEAHIALEKARSMKVIDLEVEILELLKDNYEKQKDYQNALKYTKEFHDAEKRLDITKREKEIGRIKDEYQLEKAEEQLKLANEINKTRTQQRDFSIILLVIVTLSMAVFAYLYYKIRKLNRQNLRITQKLSENNQIKDKIFSIIGHDLRGSYSGTLNFLYLSRDKELNEDEHDFMIDKVISRSKQGLETLDNLLIWGYSQLRGIKLNVSEFDGSLSVKKNILLLEEGILEKSLKIDNQIPDNLMLKADQNHFDFIIRNLLSNAVKFSFDNGEISLSTTLVDNGFYQIAIKDSGCGMTQKQLYSIFTHDVSTTLGTKQEKGTGLGLLLCKEFVEINDGRITVESTEGQGSIFYFTIKAA